MVVHMTYDQQPLQHDLIAQCLPGMRISCSAAFWGPPRFQRCSHSRSAVLAAEHWLPGITARGPHAQRSQGGTMPVTRSGLIHDGSLIGSLQLCRTLLLWSELRTPCPALHPTVFLLAALLPRALEPVWRA
jgi:hypothetical protein